MSPHCHCQSSANSRTHTSLFVLLLLLLLWREQKTLPDAKTLTELKVANDAIVALCFKVFGGEDVFEDVRIDTFNDTPPPC